MELVKSEVSLVIYGLLDDINEVNYLEKYGKVRLNKKGDKISNVIPELERDVFTFTYEIKENYERDIINFVDIIDRLDLDRYRKKENDVKIRIYIQSEYAQMYFALSDKVINKLQRLNLDVEFSIFSWGGIEK